MKPDYLVSKRLVEIIMKGSTSKCCYFQNPRFWERSDSGSKIRLRFPIPKRILTPRQLLRSSIQAAIQTFPMALTETTTTRVEPLSSSSSEQFFWTYTEEPHRTRRQAIIKAHPEVCTFPSHMAHRNANQQIKVLKLCGPEPLTKWLVLAVVSLQVLCAACLRNTPILSAPFLLTAYIIGATANQNLFLAIHEISHNLAFKSPMANRLLAIFANLPIGIPYSASFRVRSSWEGKKRRV